MKKIFKYIAGSALIMGAVGCSTKTDIYSAEPKMAAVEAIQIADDQNAVISPEESQAYFGSIKQDDVFSLKIQEIVYDVTNSIGDNITTPNDVWATVIDLGGPFSTISNYRGSEPVYPASVVKVPYMVATYAQLQSGMLETNEELQRDLVTMIEVSDNFSTNRILERLTGTTDGPSLTADEMADFVERRYAVNRYFDSVGLPDIFAINKTYATGIRLYGRELDMLGQRAGDNYENSNMLTTNDTAKLMAAIYDGEIVGTEESAKMKELLRRSSRDTFLSDLDYPNVKETYSKSGYTGLCRHDAVIFEFENEDPIVVVVFSKTRNVGERSKPQVIEAVCERILKELRPMPANK